MAPLGFTSDHITVTIPVTDENVDSLTKDMTIEEGVKLVKAATHKFPSILDATGSAISANLLEPYQPTSDQIEWRKEIRSQHSGNDLSDFFKKANTFIKRLEKQGKATDKQFELPCGLVVMAERFKFSDELINNPLNTHNNITYVKSNMDIEQKVFESSHPMNKLVMEEIENFQQSTGYRPANENDLAEILEYIPGANEKEKLITLSLLIGRTSDFLFSTKNGSSKRLRITKQMYKSSSLENHSSLAANLLMVKELDFRKS